MPESTSTSEELETALRLLRDLSSVQHSNDLMVWYECPCCFGDRDSSGVITHYCDCELANFLTKHGVKPK